MSALTQAELRAAIEDVLYLGALFLDGHRFGDWLDRTTSDFRYRIQAFSPELRREMTWLDHDKTSLAALIELLPKHHVNGAQWLRHVTLYTLTPEGDAAARAVSALSIFHTEVDVGDSHVGGGSSRLFAVGHYRDVFRRVDERWQLAERTVELQTRQLGIGSHSFP